MKQLYVFKADKSAIRSRIPVDLASTLTGERPDLRVLLVSGYSADLSRAEVRQQPGRYFLQKPFSSARFVEAVRACLDSR